MMRCILITIGLLHAVCANAQVVGGAVEDSEIWQLMAGFSAGEALVLLEEAPETPEQQLAMATALLGKYPQTAHNVARAEMLLKELVETKEPTKIQAAAWYLLGRIAHIFHEGREEEAAGYYRQLRENFPDDQLADSATVKLALITMNGLGKGQATAEVRAVIEEMPVPRNRSAQSDFYTVVAEFYLERSDLAAALNSLQKVRALGVNKGKNEADLLVQIGRVGEELGQSEVSIEAYQMFLKKYPTDTRNYMIKEQLKKSLAGGSR